jgi:ABC-2 type transport system permease protein
VTPYIILPLVAVFVAVRLTLRIRGRNRDGDSTPVRRDPTSRLPSNDVLLVATREVRQRLRGKMLPAVTLVMLLVIAAAIVIPTLGGNSTHHGKVAVTGRLSTDERSAILAAAQQTGSTVEIVEEPTVADAESAVDNGDVDLAVIDDSSVVVKRALTDTDDSDTAQAARALSQQLGEQHAFEAAHLTAGQTSTLAHITPVPIRGLKPAKSTSSDHGAALIGLILLFVMLSQYGTWTLIGVMEEKASRVVEVLLAAIKPTQLLGGKVLGIGALVFGQATILVAFSLGLAAAVGSNVLDGTAPLVIVAVLGWLLIGYAFYSWVFAAAGSLVERQDQVQAIAFPITIPLIIGYVSSLTAVNGDHASAFVTTLAYLPPTAPFAMPVLVSLHAATWWEFTLSALISLASTVAVARFAATVYRRAVLRTGRRVRLREILHRPTA